MIIGFENSKIIEEFDKQYYQVNSYEKLIKKFVDWTNCPPIDESKFYFNFNEKNYLIEYIGSEGKPGYTFFINILPKNELKKGLALYVDRKSEYLRNIDFEDYLKQYLNFVFLKV